MPDLTRDEARRLTQQVLDGLIAADKALEAIIRGAGWEALDYPDFQSWWNAELRGRTRLTEIAKAHVVYALFDVGYTAEEVATSGVGVGDQVAASLQQQHHDGVPASLATTRKPVAVRPFTRNLPGAAATLHLDVTAGEIAAWKELGKKADFDYRREAANAVRSHFVALAAEMRGAGGR